MRVLLEGRFMKETKMKENKEWPLEEE